MILCSGLLPEESRRLLCWIAGTGKNIMSRLQTSITCKPEEHLWLGALDLYGISGNRPLFLFPIMRGEDGRFYILRLDKESRKLSSTPVNETFQEMSYGLGDGNIAGLDNDVDGGIPFWPCYVYGDQVRVQVVNTTLLEELRGTGISATWLREALQTGPDQNPVVIIYTFR